jgi:hypothetical protein
VGVVPFVGSVVMSLTLKIPNCMTDPAPEALGFPVRLNATDRPSISKL